MTEPSDVATPAQFVAYTLFVFFMGGIAGWALTAGGFFK